MFVYKAVDIGKVPLAFEFETNKQIKIEHASNSNRNGKSLPELPAAGLNTRVQ
jgi:hypothetical protein